MMSDDQKLTLDEVADRPSVPKSTIVKLVVHGHLTAWVMTDELKAYVDSCRVPARDET